MEPIEIGDWNRLLRKLQSEDNELQLEGLQLLQIFIKTNENGALLCKSHMVLSSVVMLLYVEEVSVVTEAANTLAAIASEVTIVDELRTLGGLQRLSLLSHTDTHTTTTTLTTATATTTATTTAATATTSATAMTATATKTTTEVMTREQERETPSESEGASKSEEVKKAAQNALNKINNCFTRIEITRTATPTATTATTAATTAATASTRSFVIKQTDYTQCALGCKLWDSAFILSRWIEDNSNTFTNKTVLELGCGPALCSIVVAAYARHVIATDYLNTILQMVDVNAQLNDVTNLTSKYLNWQDVAEARANADIPDCDIVIGSDVVYGIAMGEYLAHTLAVLLSPPQQHKMFLGVLQTNRSVNGIENFVSCLQQRGLQVEMWQPPPQYLHGLADSDGHEDSRAQGRDAPSSPSPCKWVFVKCYYNHTATA